MIQVEVQVGAEFTSSAQRAGRAVGDAVADALRIAAMEAANEARRLAPVKTGTLRRSIQVMEAGAQEVFIGSQVPYAARIEFGFAGRDSLGRVYSQAARPYLRPAIETTRGQMRRVFEEEVKRALGGR